MSSLLGSDENIVNLLKNNITIEKSNNNVNDSDSNSAKSAPESNLNYSQ